MKSKLSSFRIIALRTFEGDEAYQDSLLTKKVRKVLRPEVTYFFYNDYKDIYDEEGNWIGIEKSSENKRVDEDFFRIKDFDNSKNQPVVSVSAIVGKNGHGKSSIIEYLLRIINNFAIKGGFAVSHNSLVYANNVYGTVFYEIGDELHYIKCNNEEVVFSQNTDFKDKKSLQRSLFYTIVSNYALYSYNSKDYLDENEDSDSPWIDGIFHKNDSYQTPVVINPQRMNGVINVNKERDLCRQRLMAIFSESESNRYINDGKYASGFAFDLEEESKFFKKTLEECFKGVANHNVLLSENRSYGEYADRLRNGEDLPNWYNQFDLETQVQFWLKYEKLWTRYKALFVRAVEIDKKFKDYGIKLVEQQYDLGAYIDLFPDVVERCWSDKEQNRQVISSIKALSKICGRLTSLELQRIVLVIDLCELWEKKLDFNKHVFASAFKNFSSDRDHAFLYVIYKTISIFKTYKPFVDWIDTEPRAFMPFIGKVEQDGKVIDWFDTIEDCFNNLFDENDSSRLKDSYEYLKLRQTINFITQKSFKKGNTDVYAERDFNLRYHVTFENLHNQIEDAKERTGESAISLLPPPIFVGEILVKDATEKRFKFSDLSSGEQQMLYSLSSVVYHLRNLNFRPNDKDKVLYQYANIILEEVELYFHPEYQRDYILNLLRYIYSSELNNLKAINVMCVTHSPFILSDIPRNNVLFLNDGMPSFEMQENTFGANIHSLMKNAFFLGMPIGGFAHEKINEMFRRLHNHEWSEELYEEIKYVSEPLLKSQLIQLYSLNKLPHDEIELLKMRIKELEDRINGGN